MKYADLVVGEAYYFARSNDLWVDHLSDGHKAVLVAEGYWKRPPNWSRDHSPIKTDQGGGVLVDVHYHHTVSREVVQTSQLRGPYEQTLAEVTERTNQRQAAEREAEQARRARRDELEALADAAREFGVTARRDGNYGIYLQADEFRKLLAILGTGQIDG